MEMFQERDVSSKWRDARPGAANTNLPALKGNGDNITFRAPSERHPFLNAWDFQSLKRFFGFHV